MNQNYISSALTHSDSVKEEILNAIEGQPKSLSDYLFYNKPRIDADATFLLSHIVPEQKVLDVGAVPPYLCGILSKAGFKDLTIADPSAESFRGFLKPAGIAWNNVNLLDGIPKEFVGSFDVVVLNEVVEHLSGNLLKVVEQVSSCLKVGGKMMVTTPNLRSLSGLYALLFCSSGLASKPFESVRAQYKRSESSDEYFGHLREYTAREVITLVEGLGLKHLVSSYQSNYTVIPNNFRERFDPFWKSPRRYHWFSKGYSLAAKLESYIPGWRLFGKHLFVKNS